MVIREHVFNNTPASDRCTVPGCGVPYVEREQRACMPREVQRAVSLSYHCIDSTEVGDRRREIFGAPAHYDKEGK
jgi:hypothetical protein